MDEVFGVVKNHRLDRAVAAGLPRQQGVVEVVEAIGLRRRSVGRDLNRLDARILDAGDGRGGGGVVAIEADEEAVIGVVEALQRGTQHLRDDRAFIPGGDEYGDGAGALGYFDLLGEQARIARSDRHPAPRSACEIDEVDEQIVEREQQEADAGEQRQLGRDAA